MSERQLLERTCDTCGKVMVINNGVELGKEVVADLESWIIIGSVKHDGHGNFLPQGTHHCSPKCGVSHLIQKVTPEPVQNGTFAEGEGPKDMGRFKELAKVLN